MTATKESNGRHIAAMSLWGDVNFSTFAFDVLALLNGTFRRGFVSSFHGFDFQAFKTLS